MISTSRTENVPRLPIVRPILSTRILSDSLDLTSLKTRINLKARSAVNYEVEFSPMFTMFISTSINDISTMTKSRMLKYSLRYFLNPSAMILMRHSATKTAVKKLLAYESIFSSKNLGPGYLSVESEIELAMIQITMKFSN